MAREQAGTPLTPVNPEVLVSASDVVTRTLREAIWYGRFRPGDRLFQDELAAQLRVSRQPVREALRQLRSEGLVVRLPQRGVVVREFSESDIRENYHLRELLESEAARLAADRMQAAELEELKAINQAMARALSENDSSTLLELNAQFHRLVHESTRMSMLARLIGQLWAGLTIYTPLFIPGRASHSISEHAAIVAALEQRNPEKAASAMRAHIRAAAKEYFHQRTRGEPQRKDRGRRK